MQNRILNIGYVTGLDYQDPLLDPHAEFQRYKQHPFVAKLLDGGKMIRYGAKTIVAGGYFAMPKIYADGVLLVGDCAGFLNSQRLKGIHAAIKSGMLAAEAIFEALLAHEFSAKRLQRYEELINESWIIPELRKVRNFHAAFQRGRWLGLANAGLQFITGGRSWGIFDRAKAEPGHREMKRLSAFGYRGDNPEQRYNGLRFDGKLTFNKVTDVFHAAVGHDEDQPAHLHVLDTNICSTRCAEEFGNPCQHFCPAAVYEMVDGGNGKRRLQINFSNCVHCKTCDIMDPYQIINWVTPEGGGGPDYKGM
jgi:electron-transferring-flavoprotein dehydrogenase